MESVILQLITTADGSEVAFNPDPISESLPTPTAQAIGSVAGVSTDQQLITSAQQATQPTSPSRSLVTHVNAAAPTAPLAAPSLIFHSPLARYTLTQYFSAYHTAIDMAAPTGTPIYSTTEGVVVNTGYLLPGGGLMVKVEHDGGYASYYAHLSAITSQVGQRVNNTTQIARVGSTGWATGPHLHFMIWKNQQAINPLALLQ
jgi:murein DD-endopeptidase MepM/ murein hydrolase activator NlpD